MGLEFKTAKKRAADKQKPVTFTWDGEEYTFTPPKAASLALMALGDDENEMEKIKAIFDWLGNKMPQKQQDRLLSRLRDPEDPADLEDLMELFKALVEEVYARPTT